MLDKRTFHHFLNQLKEEHPHKISLIESIQEKFDHEFTPLTQSEKRALKTYPIQYIKRIYEPNREWTTKLHIWAEHAVPEILEIDPVYLSFKNSYEDSILMCLVIGATGAYTEKVDYELVEKILNTDFSYEDVEKDEEENDVIIVKSAIDEKDGNGQTIIDYLIDFAYGTELYKNQEPDPKLQDILIRFSKSESKGEKPEGSLDVPKNLERRVVIKEEPETSEEPKKPETSEKPEKKEDKVEEKENPEKRKPKERED